MQKIEQGTWVEVRKILLQPEERSDRLPEDTKQIPYVMRVRGFLSHAASINEEVEIVTLSGRKVKGTLTKRDPGYEHGFGSPVYELLKIGEEEHKILNK